MFPKKPITDHYSYIADHNQQPVIVAEVTWPYMKFKAGRTVLSSEFHETEEKADYWFNLKKGKVGKISMFDLAPLEIVDAHQWLGATPIELKNDEGRVFDKEPALWDIAGVDNADAERLVIMRTHGHKDAVFRVTTRFNTLLDYSRNLLAPWQDYIERGEEVPLDELQEALRDTPPNFKFVEHRSKEEFYQAISDREEAIQTNDGKNIATNSAEHRKTVFWVLAALGVFILLGVMFGA